MLRKVRQSKKETTGIIVAGFTIIEVMIVLAIAGLIMGIVFVAVPALQRNARTTQRNADAQLIISAVNECLSNKNNVITSCDSTVTAGEISSFLDVTKLKVLDEAFVAAQVVTAANGAAVTTRTLAGAAIDNTWKVSYATKCNNAGDAGTGTTNPREYAILYGVENNAGNTVVRCLQG